MMSKTSTTEKRRMVRPRTVVLFLVLGPLLGVRPSSGLDAKLFRMLEGDNRHVGVNYAVEAVSLSSPMIEGGWAIKRGIEGWIREDQRALGSGALAAMALAGTQILSVSLKYLVRRDRPVRQRYHPRLWNTRYTPSFPSGHAASSATMATLIIAEYPRYRFPLMAYAALSGYAQIYTGNHYPSDVLAGWILGYGTARLMLRYQRAIRKCCPRLSRTSVFRTQEGWGIAAIYRFGSENPHSVPALFP